MYKTTFITDLKVVLYNPMYKTTFIADLKLFYTNSCIKQLLLQIVSCFIQTHVQNNFYNIS